MLSRRKSEPRLCPGRWISLVLLLALALLTVFPLYWMFVLATHTRETIFTAPPPFMFGTALERNYEGLLATLPFWRNVWNSVYVASLATLTTLFFCSLAGFGFALYEFRGRNVLFGFLIASLTFPQLLNIIPYYLIVDFLGWLDTPRALWFPGMASAFGIFLMRQFFRQLPGELIDAAKLDGCNTGQLIWHVLLPLTRPALAAFAVFSVVSHWNDFFWPLVVVRTARMYTPPAGIAFFASADGGENWGVIMAAGVIVITPLVLFFLVARRQFVASLAQSAVKG